MSDRPRSTNNGEFRSPNIVIHNSLASNLPHRHSPLASDLSGRPYRSTSSPLASTDSLKYQRSSSFSSHSASPMARTPTLGSSPSNKPTSPRVPKSAAAKERTRSSSNHGPREMVYVDSKEGLSEMVTNIRGISNSLANVTLAVSVQNVLVVAKMTDDELPAGAREMVEWLLQWEYQNNGLRSANSQLELAVRPRRRSCEVNTQLMARRNSQFRRRDSEQTIKGSRNDLGATNPVSGEASDRGLADRADRLTELLASSVSLSEEAVLEDPCFDTECHATGCSPQPLTVYIEREFASKPEFELSKLTDRLDDNSKNRLKFWSTDDHLDAEEIDLVITLGGDGTVLYTSWLFQKMVPPTLSFGMGSLGFMTENSFEEYPQVLEEHLNSGICCALRMRFECTVMRTRNQNQCGSDDLERELNDMGQSHHSLTHTRDGEYTILNEVVVDRGPNPFVTMTELYGNFELLTSIKADGVVISTPTGSTAYSMSAGGSLVHPDISARLISPICPHTLSFRPLVVPDSMVLHIGVPYDARSSAFVSFDGKARVELRRGDFLAINASPYPFPKVLPQENSSVSWVQQLSRTLHWNEQKRPKRYTDGSHDKLS